MNSVPKVIVRNDRLYELWEIVKKGEKTTDAKEKLDAVKALYPSKSFVAMNPRSNMLDEEPSLLCVIYRYVQSPIVFSVEDAVVWNRGE